MTQWSKTDRAQWVLENGSPEFVWIFENTKKAVFKRAHGTNIPPWNKGRIKVYDIDSQGQFIGLKETQGGTHDN